jgi:hypothetical protein
MREASTESDIGGLNRAARPIVGPRLYMPGSLAACVYLVGETHIFVSKHNHGAKEVAAKLVSHLKAGSQASVAEYTPRLQTRSRTQSGQNQRSNCESQKRRSFPLDDPRRRRSHDGTLLQLPNAHSLWTKACAHAPLKSKQEWLLVYLSERVFTSTNGNVNQPLVDELHNALEARVGIILLHPVASVTFEYIVDTCPRDLIAAGLLRCIAEVQLRPEPYEAISAAIIGQMLQGKAYPKRWLEASVSGACCAESQETQKKNISSGDGGAARRAARRIWKMTTGKLVTRQPLSMSQEGPKELTCLPQLA